MRDDARVDAAHLSRDWHMAYAQLLVDLSERLHAASTDRERMELMTALQTHLDEVPRPGAART